MAEFTGERVVPGLVDDDLFNEHVARYRFAARVAAQFAVAPAVLDAGCGTGYGAASFDRAASVSAIDVSASALLHAREHFGRAGVRYVQARCETLPFADASFDLVCAFEVIEHLERWGELLTEARRVLKRGGLLLVSTPNEAYYAEARAKAGPNPFHAHEFGYAEFREALRAVFPCVRLWSQNHAASIVFAPANPLGSAVDAEGDPHPEQAHFFLAACGEEEFAHNDLYAWIPATGNLLRERERHIAKLEAELGEKNAWLDRRALEHTALHEEHGRTLVELRERNQWALRVDAELEEARGHIRLLHAEAEERLTWIADLESRIASGEREIERLNGHREELERDLAARAAWGFALDAQVQSLGEQIAGQEARALELIVEVAELRRERQSIAESKWMRFGHRLQLGPRIE